MRTNLHVMMHELISSKRPKMKRYRIEWIVLTIVSANFFSFLFSGRRNSRQSRFDLVLCDVEQSTKKNNDNGDAIMIQLSSEIFISFRHSSIDEDFHMEEESMHSIWEFILHLFECNRRLVGSFDSHFR